MKSQKPASETIASLDAKKYDEKILKQYATTYKKKEALIERGWIAPRGYELRTPDQSDKLVDILTINQKPSQVH